MSDTSDFSDVEDQPKVKRTRKLQPPSSDDENDIDPPATEELDKNKVSFPVRNPFANIKNKEIRQKHFRKLKAKLNKEKKKARQERQKSGAPKTTGHTIESLREKDQTIVENIDDSENEEIKKDLEIDEYSEYYAKKYTPKVLITFGDNPVTKTRRFGKELARIIPNSISKVRNRASVKDIIKSAIREEYTDVLIVNEDRRQPNGLLVIHLPDGPTAHFKVSNVKITSELRKKHKDISTHRPEVILNNFTTRLGLNVGRMLGALFNHDPQFRGRRAVTFHNQRDYIFFRHHIYQFTKDGKRARLRELGPRFTLKLRSMQEGTFDSKTGDYEWMITNKRHAMESSRRKFFL